MLRVITEVKSETAVCVRKGVCGSGVRYRLTLSCGHELVTKVHPSGSKQAKPEVGRKKQCKDCKQIHFHAPDKCSCGYELPWHLVELTEPGERYSHMCSCGRKFELSREVKGRMLYVGQGRSPWASVT